jgi:hypothetical protein
MNQPPQNDAKVNHNNEIVIAAIEVCKWVSWIGDPRAKAAVETLKEKVESAVGQEIMEYN